MWQVQLPQRHSPILSIEHLTSSGLYVNPVLLSDDSPKRLHSVTRSSFSPLSCCRFLLPQITTVSSPAFSDQKGSWHEGKDFCLFCPVIASMPTEHSTSVGRGSTETCSVIKRPSSRRISLPPRPWEQEWPVLLPPPITGHLVNCLFLLWRAQKALPGSPLSCRHDLHHLSLSEPQVSLVTGCSEVQRGDIAYGSNGVYRDKQKMKQ